MVEPITLDHVRRALSLPDFDAQAAQARMAPIPRPERPPETPGTARQAGVLVLLYPNGGDGKLHFVLMRRNEYPGVHSGQIGLPGGKHEDGESLQETALREAEEEVGAPRQQIQVIGKLTRLYVPPSDYDIHPTVGYCDHHPVWQADPHEVAEIIEVPLDLLLDDSIKGSEQVTRYERPFTIHYYHVGPHKVWGATAIMLSELEGRLRAALNGQF